MCVARPSCNFIRTVRFLKYMKYEHYCGHTLVYRLPLLGADAEVFFKAVNKQRRKTNYILTQL